MQFFLQQFSKGRKVMNIFFTCSLYTENFYKFYFYNYNSEIY